MDTAPAALEKLYLVALLAFQTREKTETDTIHYI